MAFAGGIVVAAEPDAPAAQRFVDAWERDDIAAMYAELTPGGPGGVLAAELPRHLRRGGGDGDHGRARARARSPRRTRPPSRAGEHAHPPVRRARRRARPAARQTARSAWAPHLVFPGLDAGRAAQPRDPGAASARRSSPPTAARSPRARPRPAPSAPRRSAVVGEVGSPSRSQAERLDRARVPSGDARPARRGSSSPSTTGSPAGPAASCSPCAEGEDADTAAGRVLATSRARARQGRAHRHRPRAPGRRRWPPSASLYGGAAVLDAQDRRGAGARRARLLGAPAAGLDLQDHHRDRGARRRHRQAVRRVPGRVLELRDRPRDPQRPRRALRRHLRRELRQLVQHGLRPARGRARRRQAGRDRRAVRLQRAAAAVRPGDDGADRPARRARSPRTSPRASRPASRRSARARSWRRRWRWRRSRRRSPTAACACRPRSPATPSSRRPPSRSR